MGNAEKEDIHKIIEEGIKSSMSTIYWIFGIANIFIVLIISGLVLPMYDDVSQTKTDIAIMKESKADLDFLQRSYVTKVGYNIMQKEEHRFDSEAILNPKMCHDVYREADRFRADQLEIAYRSSEGIKLR